MHDPGLSKKFFFKQKKLCINPAFQKKSIYNKKKGPHPAQRHDSNSVFRRLIAAYFFKRKKTEA